MATIYIDYLTQGYNDLLAKGLQWTRLAPRFSHGARVAVKPNLTFPTFKPGVMTNPEAVEAVLAMLRDSGCRIHIVESDSGGYNRFSMDAVFASTGIAGLAQRYGAQVVNLSNAEPRFVQFTVKHKTLRVPMPAVLLDDIDVFVTMPVPKIHMNTTVSVGVKNQWGVLQNPSDRLRLHPVFSEVVYQVNKLLPPIVSIVDGRYGLTKSGPMEGDVVPLNWLMVSDDVFRADYACCQLMGIDPNQVPYLKEIFRKEGITGLSDTHMNRNLGDFVVSSPFYLKRRWTDYPGLWAFKSRSLAYLAYRSPLAGFLHWLLYLFRTPFYDYAQKR